MRSQRRPFFEFAPMRVFWFTITLVLIAALAVGLQTRFAGNGVAQPPIAVRAAGGAARSTHPSGASTAIRMRQATATAWGTPGATPSVAHVAPAQAPRSTEVAASRERTEAAPPRDAQDEAQPQPKPAGELFLPFIADDPNQVFAPATVQYHAAVQGETQDPEWGPAAAAALRGYIEALFGERFEIPYVDCRQNLCELQVAGRPGGDRDADMRDIQQAMSGMRQQPWWDAFEFDQENGTVTSAQDGRMLLLWFFSRK